MGQAARLLHVLRCLEISGPRPPLARSPPPQASAAASYTVGTRVEPVVRDEKGAPIRTAAAALSDERRPGRTHRHTTESTADLSGAVGYRKQPTARPQAGART